MLLNKDRAYEVMDKHGLDALVAARPENVYYCSDYGTQNSFIFGRYGICAAVLPRDEMIPPTLIVSEFELFCAATWMPEIRAIKGLAPHVGDDSTLAIAEKDFM